MGWWIDSRAAQGDCRRRASAVVGEIDAAGRTPVIRRPEATVKEAVWFEFSVSGSDKPLMLNPGPLVLAEETVTLAAPVLLMMTVWLPL